MSAKSSSVSPGKPTMKSEVSARSGRAARSALDRAQIVGAGVAAVHRGENPVRAGLHRQMQLRRKLRQIAMHRDQVVVHVARMAGGVAQPRDAGDFGDATQAAARASRRGRPVLAVIGVDVLPDQRDLAHAGVGEVAHFVEDLLDRPRDFRAARVGHDAEGAELVAAFLHGDERRHAARARRGPARRGKEIELVLDRKLGLDDRILRVARARAVPAGGDSSAARPRDRPPARGG